MIKFQGFKGSEQAIINDRRHFHAYPETGFEEKQTAQYIAGVLKELGLDVVKNLAQSRLDKPLMGGEDFAYYLNKIPGALFWLGCGKAPLNEGALLHNAIS